MRLLEPGWRDRLCEEPETPRWLGQAPALSEDIDWVELEFGRTCHADGRLRTRILAMGKAWEREPGKPVSAAFPPIRDQQAANRNPIVAKKDRYAACRLLANPKVSMDSILESHRMATVQRCRAETEILAVQDTTMLDLPDLKTQESGSTKPDGGGSGGSSLSAQVTLAVSTSGRGPGVLDLKATIQEDLTTEATQGGSLRRKDGLALARQVGRASPGTRMIYVWDSGMDIRDMFEAQAKEPDAAGLLVRLGTLVQPSAIVSGRTMDIREYISGLPVVGTASQDGIFASQGCRTAEACPERITDAELRVARVDPMVPGTGSRALPVTAVLASRTAAPPKGGLAPSWILLSSEGSADLEGARETVSRH